MSELAGRTAIVTGGGRNIGRAIALALAEAGAAVVVNGRSDRAAVDEVVGEIERRAARPSPSWAMSARKPRLRPWSPPQRAFGGVDILVNNAAGRPEKRSRR